METAETTQTKITIKKTLVITAVVISVIAAFSQLFVETTPSDIQKARKENIAQREARDQLRDEILVFLEDKVSEQNFESADFLTAANLLHQYKQKAKDSDTALVMLNKAKELNRIRGFKHVNAFLQGIGLPVYIFFTGLIIYIIGIFLKREKYSPVGNLVKFIAKASFVVSLTYIYWALNPKADLHQSIYVANLLIASFFSSKVIIWLLKKNFFNIPYLKHHKLINALARMVDYVIIDVNEKFISEDNKVEFVKSYDNQLDEISKVIE